MVPATSTRALRIGTQMRGCSRAMTRVAPTRSSGRASTPSALSKLSKVDSGIPLRRT